MVRHAVVARRMELVRVWARIVRARGCGERLSTPPFGHGSARRGRSAALEGSVQLPISHNRLKSSNLVPPTRNIVINHSIAERTTRKRAAIKQTHRLAQRG